MRVGILVTISLLFVITTTALEYKWQSYDETNTCKSKKEDFVKFSFKAGVTKVLQGIQSRPDDLNDKDIIGTFAIVPQPVDGEYFLDGKYNNQDYKAQEGTVSSTSGDTYTAFRIYPATIKATRSLVGTEHHIYYKFNSYDEDYNVYQFDDSDDSFKLYYTVKAKDMVTNGFTHLVGTNQAELTRSQIYVFVKASVTFTNLNKIKDGLYRAKVHDDYKYKVEMIRYNMPDAVTLSKAEDEVGPADEMN